MIMNYVTQIRTKVGIHAMKKSSNIFDGSYKSIYQGNGLDFENLREYIPGDSIRDIDWKASSRSGKVLVKRYIAEKKHNIMIVFDTGKKMCGHTGKQELKQSVARDVGGVLAYLAAKNGDSVGAIYNHNGMIKYHQLKTGLANVEMILTQYDKENFEGYNADIEKSLEYIIRNIRRRMIVFIISDAYGISSISDNTLKKLSYQHDVETISIEDISFANGISYDMDNSTYVPKYLSDNKKIKELEANLKDKINGENRKKLLKYKINNVSIDGEDEIVEKVIELLGGHRKCQ